VQTNRASLRPSFQRVDYKTADKNRDPGHGFAGRQPNQEILLHERKREVEVKCLELQDELEEKGLSAEDVEGRVDALRQKLLQQLESSPTAIDPRAGKALRSFDTHMLAQAKKAENERVAAAFRIRTDDYVEGSAFNPEVQVRSTLCLFLSPVHHIY
jgi:hypothetical protein